MTSQNLVIETPEELFLRFLDNHGHPLDGIINVDSSKFHYFKCPHGSKTDARYKYHSDGIVSAYLKCWHCDIDETFCSKKESEVSSEEWKAHIDHLAADKIKNELEIQQVQTEVAALAKVIFSSADEKLASSHGYVLSKNVKNYGARVIVHEDENTKKAKCYKGTLLIPCFNANEELVNFERIYWDKNENKYQKRPLAGGLRSGTLYVVGIITEQPDVIYLAEGGSSAFTAHEATGYPVVVTFNCGNILNVAKIVRSKYPTAHIKIIADDDRWKIDPKKRDSGLKAAKKACSNVINTSFFLPDFSVLGLSDEQLKKEEPTDINDLFALLMTGGLKRPGALEIVMQQMTSKSAPHSIILEQLIKRIIPVNFRELANLQETDKLKSNHMIIIVIEEILALAKENNWGICKNFDFTYIFNGEYWSLLDADELKTFLGEAAEALGLDKFFARHFDFRDKLHKQFMALANLPTPEQPKDTVLINLKNGTFEITPDGIKLNDFNRADFMTYQLAFDYNPKATAPMFETYLNRVLPDKQLQHILAEFLGYVFIRPTTLKLEKTLLLYGSGANGKSVFYEVVRKLLGEENTSEYSLQSLTEEKGYFRASIANKLVNYASEISGKLGASIFKQLVSGEPVEARLPYGKPFILKQYAKLIFNCNELPKDVE